MKTEDNRFPDVSDETPDQRDDVSGRLAFHDSGGRDAASDEVKIRGVTSDGREVRAYRAGESIYEDKKRKAGWSDFWDDIHIGNLLRAREFGPETRSEERALDQVSAGAAIPAPLRAQVVDDVKEASLLGRTRLRTLPMESASLDVARFDSVPSGSWLDPGSTFASTDPNITSVTLNAKTHRGRVRVRRETLDDSVGLDAALRRSMRQSLTEALNSAILVGDSGSTTVPTGISQTTSVNTTPFGSTSGEAPASTATQWDAVLQARQSVLDRQANADRLEMVTSPRVSRQFFSLRDSNEQPLRKPNPLQDSRFTETVASPTTLSSTNGAAGGEILMGDLSNAVVGARLEPEVRVIDAELADTYSFDVVFGARWDVAVLQPDALQRLRPITT